MELPRNLRLQRNNVPHRRESLNMAITKILGLVLLVAGLILLFMAYQSSQSLGDQVSEAVTGRFTDSTVWLVILGAASSVAGVALLLFGKSESHH
ncbi:DUF3185 family protein [Thioalkalivibrio sp. ALR17-21]|uniref:DUF3185 family protein n=1 Tax=Thioalkalivibrio sp. ALR17-21 TaxID=1269813 RepID=UPI00350FAC6E